VRDGEFNRMSDGSDIVLLECGNDVRFGTAEDSPMELGGFFTDGEYNYLDNFCLGIATGTLVQPINKDSF